MRNLNLYCALTLLFSVGFVASCQTQPATNAGNGANATSASANHDGHDMSNMGNHDMSNTADHDMSKMHPVQSAPNAASQPFDLQFIDSMSHHHQGAVMMAEMIVNKTQRPELKAFAQKIIDEQKKEIETMKGWREQWYSGTPSALNLELPGMKMSEMEESHMKEMDKMSAKDLDVHFTEMMTKHHEGAVLMAKEALKRADHPEIKKLAEDVIKAQEAEIQQMRRWNEEWSKDKRTN